MKYRKKPVLVNAIQFKDNEKESNFTQVVEFIGTKCFLSGNKMFIATLEGLMEVSPNDYVIKGVKGEFYPCKPDIFELTYEEIK